MNVTVFVRHLNKNSEVWLKRQLESHSFFTTVYSGDVNEPLIGNFSFKVKFFGAKNKSPLKLLEKFKIFSSEKIKSIQQKRLIRELKAGSILLFHYVDFALNFEKLISTGKYKVFIYCHGYDITWDKKDAANPSKNYFRDDYVSRVVAISRHVSFICNSYNTRKKLLAIGIPEGKTFINYFGILMPGIAKKKQEVFTILYLGRLVDFKGADYVIKAFEIASGKGLQAKLVIAGDGILRPYIELLKKRSVYSDNIKILGSVNASAAQQLFSEASVFTAHNCLGELSNQEEAFGVSIIEAMSYGLPVVTGRSGGVSESVVDGETGILFEPFDVEAHANALLKLYNDEHFYDQLSENSIKYGQGKFSIEQENENLLKIFSTE